MSLARPPGVGSPSASGPTTARRHGPMSPGAAGPPAHLWLADLFIAIAVQTGSRHLQADESVDWEAIRRAIPALHVRVEKAGLTATPCTLAQLLLWLVPQSLERCMEILIDSLLPTLKGHAGAAAAGESVFTGAAHRSTYTLLGGLFDSLVPSTDRLMKTGVLYQGLKEWFALDARHLPPFLTQLLAQHEGEGITKDELYLWWTSAGVWEWRRRCVLRGGGQTGTFLYLYHFMLKLREAAGIGTGAGSGEHPLAHGVTLRTFMVAIGHFHATSVTMQKAAETAFQKRLQQQQQAAHSGAATAGGAAGQKISFGDLLSLLSTGLPDSFRKAMQYKPPVAPLLARNGLPLSPTAAATITAAVHPTVEQAPDLLQRLEQDEQAYCRHLLQAAAATHERIHRHNLDGQLSFDSFIQEILASADSESPAAVSSPSPQRTLRVIHTLRYVPALFLELRDWNLSLREFTASFCQAIERKMEARYKPAATAAKTAGGQTPMFSQASFLSPTKASSASGAPGSARAAATTPGSARKSAPSSSAKAAAAGKSGAKGAEGTTNGSAAASPSSSDITVAASAAISPHDRTPSSSPTDATRSSSSAAATPLARTLVMSPGAPHASSSSASASVDVSLTQHPDLPSLLAATEALKLEVSKDQDARDRHQREERERERLAAEERAREEAAAAALERQREAHIKSEAQEAREATERFLLAARRDEEERRALARAKQIAEEQNARESAERLLVQARKDEEERKAQAKAESEEADARLKSAGPVNTTASHHKKQASSVSQLRLLFEQGQASNAQGATAGRVLDADKEAIARTRQESLRSGSYGGDHDFQGVAPASDPAESPKGYAALSQAARDALAVITKDPTPAMHGQAPSPISELTTPFPENATSQHTDTSTTGVDRPPVASDSAALPSVFIDAPAAAASPPSSIPPNDAHEPAFPSTPLDLLLLNSRSLSSASTSHHQPSEADEARLLQSPSPQFPIGSSSPSLSPLPPATSLPATPMITASAGLSAHDEEEAEEAPTTAENSQDAPHQPEDDEHGYAYAYAPSSMATVDHAATVRVSATPPATSCQRLQDAPTQRKVATARTSPGPGHYYSSSTFTGGRSTTMGKGRRSTSNGGVQAAIGNTERHFASSIPGPGQYSIPSSFASLPALPGRKNYTAGLTLPPKKASILGDETRAPAHSIPGPALKSRIEDRQSTRKDAEIPAPGSYDLPSTLSSTPYAAIRSRIPEPEPSSHSSPAPTAYTIPDFVTVNAREKKGPLVRGRMEGAGVPGSEAAYSVPLAEAAKRLAAAATGGAYNRR